MLEIHFLLNIVVRIEVTQIIFGDPCILFDQLLY